MKNLEKEIRNLQSIKNDPNLIKEILNKYNKEISILREN
jgi:hypothetical protein